MKELVALIPENRRGMRRNERYLRGVASYVCA